VEEIIHSRRPIRFGTFEVELQAGELRKGGLKLKLSGQPFQVLAILLEQPGAIVTREELQKRLWPDTFVDVDHNLNTAINKIREALGDSAENPCFVETLPRRGYRFIAPVEGAGAAKIPVELLNRSVPKNAPPRGRVLRLSILFVACVFLAGAGLFIYKRWIIPPSFVQRALTRITFDEGLQIGATWSPDGRYIAYSSDRGGKFDIWVQQVSGGDPVQITKGPGQNWQPDWSPDGKYIAYRSEEGNGGLYIVPALGGAGLQRKIASFGYYPRWSPDSSQLLFRTHFTQSGSGDRFYLVDLAGSAPREVLADFISQRNLLAESAAWHPDGKRISIWQGGRAPGFNFWTVPAAGGVAVRTETAPEILRQLKEVSAGAGIPEWTEKKFSWAPSGKAIYLGRSFRGANNLWKMTVDPNTLQATAIERLTTGPGLDAQPALSADGGKLAFSGETLHIRAWLFPFDATRGRITGAGQAVTSPGEEAWMADLSRDGGKLAFCSMRAGRYELWEKSMPDGREAPIVADDFMRDGPHWSPDGMRLAYTREKLSTGERQLMVWSSQSHNEEPLPVSSKTENDDYDVYDWSLDSKWLLVSRFSRDPHQQRGDVAHELGSDVWLLPVVAPGARAGPTARKIISDPTFNLYQPHFSPDRQWIVFEAVRDLPTPNSTLYVMTAAGGPWTRISEGEHWDDKPRWSPDGKMIYFVSGRGGAFNVWGIHFNPIQGRPVGEAFRVTTFENPALRVPDRIGNVELSLTQDKLVITMEERSGSIWVLDGVDR
jgi:Tol biopolymer transport system component/DNA-binding winged helix-turn-helix (wHTH) protein